MLLPLNIDSNLSCFFVDRFSARLYRVSAMDLTLRIRLLHWSSSNRVITELPMPASVPLAELSLSLGTRAPEFVAASRLAPVLQTHVTNPCYKLVLQPRVTKLDSSDQFASSGGWCNGKNTVDSV